MVKKISGGTVHKLPADLRKMIESSPKVRKIWDDITPLARNEWICWTLSPKTSETRKHHVEVAKSKMLRGMRRPCCWAGCMHR